MQGSLKELSDKVVESRVTPGTTRFGRRGDQAGAHWAGVEGGVFQPLFQGLAFEQTRGMKLNVVLVAQSFFFAERRGAAGHWNESRSWMSSGTCGEPGSVQGKRSRKGGQVQVAQGGGPMTSGGKRFDDLLFGFVFLRTRYEATTILVLRRRCVQDAPVYLGQRGSTGGQRWCPPRTAVTVVAPSPGSSGFSGAGLVGHDSLGDKRAFGPGA